MARVWLVRQAGEVDFETPKGHGPSRGLPYVAGETVCSCPTLHEAQQWLDHVLFARWPFPGTTMEATLTEDPLRPRTQAAGQ